MGTRDGTLLDILMEERIHKGLDKALNDNELYQSAQKEVDEAINDLEKAGLSREQNKVVDKAIFATNASRAAYGATAYKQGLYDGIRLMSEVNQVNHDSERINKKYIDLSKYYSFYECLCHILLC